MGAWVYWWTLARCHATHSTDYSLTSLRRPGQTSLEPTSLTDELSADNCNPAVIYNVCIYGIAVFTQRSKYVTFTAIDISAHVKYVLLFILCVQSGVWTFLFVSLQQCLSICDADDLKQIHIRCLVHACFLVFYN